VIVGRDATVILAGMRGALHVRLQAPVEARVSRAAQTPGVSRDVAERRLQREDRVRTQMSQRLMHWDPAEAGHYDLVIDTSETSLDDAVDMIVVASRTGRGGGTS
jgi:glucuronide carrier protein